MSWNRRRMLQLSAAFLGGGAVGYGLHGLRLRRSAQADEGRRLWSSGKSSMPYGLPNPPRGDVRIAVISDLNEAYGSTAYGDEVKWAIALLPEWQPDLVLCGGDMVAGQKRDLSDTQVQAMWTAFEAQIAKPLRAAQLPFGFTIGNHDASRAVRENAYFFQNERAIAADYWTDPAHDPGLPFVDRYQFPFYYSFQQQGVFYLVWDASSGAPMPVDDVAWVKRSLGSPLAQRAKLRIVIGHLPLYAVAKERDRPGEVMDHAADLQALLEEYGVHTYISGHHHAYYPGHVGQLQLLHTGALGSGPRPLLQGDALPRKTLTLVDVDLTRARTVYTTLDMQTLSLVAVQDLPRLVPSANGAVIRRDLTWDSLNAQEQADCVTHLTQSVCETTT